MRVQKGPCAALAQWRSAFVDLALSEDDRLRMSIHLADCLPCRRDVEDLRAVADLISRAPNPDPAAPADLSARLVSIAGTAPVAPLFGRPTRRTRRSAWPWTRRARRLRATVAGVAVGAAVAMAGAAGYLAAPAEVAAISDPTAEAEAEFGAALNRSPLGSEALSTMLRADPADLLSAAGTATAPGPAESTGPPLTAAEALHELERAAVAPDSTRYTGEQTFLGRGATRTVDARLSVTSRPGEGSQVSVQRLAGGPLVAGFTPAPVSTRMVDTDLLTLLRRNYELSGLRGSSVAGRPATMVRASRGGVPASQWWVDEATGLVLWQESFDDAGMLELEVGFTAVEMTGSSELPPSPQVAAGATSTTMTLSNDAQLRSAGWFCERELAELSLVRLRADRPDDPDAMHLVYSDGLRTLTVFEQRGSFRGAPGAFSWDPSLAAYVQHGNSNLATWQSGDRVFTVITDGSAEQLAGAVALLPHDAPLERTTMERIQAGWEEILADMRG